MTGRAWNPDVGHLLRRAWAWCLRTIARKLWLAFFSVFLLTYLATALVVLTAVRTAATDAELAALGQTAHLTFNNLDGRIAQLATNLRAWSKLEVMRDLAAGDPGGRIARTLENLRSNYHLKGDLLAFDNAGHLVAGPGKAGTEIPLHWRAGDELRFIDKHIDPLDGRDIVALSAPVQAQPGTELGTLVLVYPWSEVHASLPDNAILLTRQRTPRLLEGHLDNPDRRADARDFAFGENWFRFGRTRYLARGATHDTGLLTNWQVVALGESGTLDRALAGVTWDLAGLCLLLAIPLTLGIRWLSWKLTGPVRELKRVVAEITDTGDLTQRVRMPSRDELGTLARAFNMMAARLQKASAEREQFVRDLESAAQDLEDKVERRTSELTAANAELTKTLADLKAAQAQLIHQEKMASLGQLVAGVAHEINNPIGFIYANFPHLEEHAATLVGLIDEMRKLPLSDDARARLEHLLADAEVDYVRDDLLKIIRSGKSGATRVKGIVSALRRFSRLEEDVVKAVRLEDCIEDTLGLLQPQLRNRIAVHRDYRLKTPVSCRPGQINQVFMNILHNAIQAIDGPGAITVATRIEGAFAVVAISDSGPGIAPEIRHRLFDPFFTTKKVGEGTGLGLSISYGIVESQGGRIEVESEDGHGATFSVCLPLPETLPVVPIPAKEDHGS